MLCYADHKEILDTIRATGRTCSISTVRDVLKGIANISTPLTQVMLKEAEKMLKTKR